MECSLGSSIMGNVQALVPVLILILMECSLGFSSIMGNVQALKCLNPYSNGMLTWNVVKYESNYYAGLNPYSNGMLTWL